LVASGPNPSQDNTPTTNPVTGLAAVTGEVDGLGAPTVAAGNTVEEGIGLVAAIGAVVLRAGASVGRVVADDDESADGAASLAVVMVESAPEAPASVEP
jgi:hypothetical protein